MPIPSELRANIWEVCNLLRGPYKRNEYRKEPHRKGKIQLVAARNHWVPMEKPLGNKLCHMGDPSTVVLEKEIVALLKEVAA